MMGAAKPASLPNRFKAAARKLDVWSSKKRMNCLGYIVRDRGHRRVPEPPESITGKIAPMGTGFALRTRARPLPQAVGRMWPPTAMMMVLELLLINCLNRRLKEVGEKVARLAEVRLVMLANFGLCDESDRFDCTMESSLVVLPRRSISL